MLNEREAVEFLETSLRPEAQLPSVLQQFYKTFLDLYNKKLWYRLTLEIEEFIKCREASRYLIPFYENFIKQWEKKMNSFSLVKYLIRASMEFPTTEKSLEFITEQAKKFADCNDLLEEYHFLVIKGAYYKLLLRDFEGCKKDIDECEKYLDERESSEVSVRAEFYGISAQYYMELKDYAQYYQAALLYLSAVEMDDLTLQQKQKIAYNLCISALLGEDLYNFGELLIHPILTYLDQSSHSWLRQLLYCFNNGGIEEFDAISPTSAFLRQTNLVDALPFLRQKLRLMTLVELIFRGTKERSGRISFEEISEKTCVKLDEVEHLVMKALNLGLIEGKINQIESYVLIYRIKPRVLDTDQVIHLSNRLQTWSNDVKKYISVLDKGTEPSEILC